MNTTENHVGAAGPAGADRPPQTVRASRPTSTPRKINEVLPELARIRGRYEDVRSDAGSRKESVRLKTRLHELRAEAARARMNGDWR